MAARKNVLQPEDPDLVTESNWMMIRFDYGAEFVLPVKEATQIMACFEKAYQFKEEYHKKPVIQPIEKNRVSSSFISSDYYKECKRNYILGVNDDDDTE